MGHGPQHLELIGVRTDLLTLTGDTRGLSRSPAHTHWIRLDDRVVMKIDSLDAVAGAKILLRVTAQIEGLIH